MDTRRVRMPGADAGPYILPLLQGVDDGARKKKKKHFAHKIVPECEESLPWYLS
jgi:hypothetical protein